MSWGAHREELLRRVAEDQRARRAITDAGLVGPILPSDPRHGEFIALVSRMTEVDTSNREWFRARISELGWPAASDVGHDGAGAAWLLAQHADADPAFQRVCLDLASAMPDGDVEPGRLAMLTDRVLLKERGVQRYGTQWTASDGEWVPQPLESPDEVDDLRRSVGLDTLEVNRQRITARYGEPGRSAEA